MKGYFQKKHEQIEQASQEKVGIAKLHIFETIGTVAADPLVNNNLNLVKHY